MSIQAVTIQQSRTPQRGPEFALLGENNNLSSRQLSARAPISLANPAKAANDYRFRFSGIIFNITNDDQEKNSASATYSSTRELIQQAKNLEIIKTILTNKLPKILNDRNSRFLTDIETTLVPQARPELFIAEVKGFVHDTFQSIKDFERQFIEELEIRPESPVDIYKIRALSILKTATAVIAQNSLNTILDGFDLLPRRGYGHLSKSLEEALGPEIQSLFIASNKGAISKSTLNQISIPEFDLDDIDPRNLQNTLNVTREYLGNIYGSLILDDSARGSISGVNDFNQFYIDALRNCMLEYLKRSFDTHSATIIQDDGKEVYSGHLQQIADFLNKVDKLFEQTRFATPRDLSDRKLINFSKYEKNANSLKENLYSVLASLGSRELVEALDDISRTSNQKERKDKLTRMMARIILHAAVVKLTGKENGASNYYKEIDKHHNVPFPPWAEDFFKAELDYLSSLGELEWYENASHASNMIRATGAFRSTDFLSRRGFKKEDYDKLINTAVVGKSKAGLVSIALRFISTFLSDPRQAKTLFRGDPDEIDTKYKILRKFERAILREFKVEISDQEQREDRDIEFKKGELAKEKALGFTARKGVLDTFAPIISEYFKESFSRDTSSSEGGDGTKLHAAFLYYQLTKYMPREHDDILMLRRKSDLVLAFMDPLVQTTLRTRFPDLYEKLLDKLLGEKDGSGKIVKDGKANHLFREIKEKLVDVNTKPEEKLILLEEHFKLSKAYNLLRKSAETDQDLERTLKLYDETITQNITPTLYDLIPEELVNFIVRNSDPIGIKTTYEHIRDILEKEIPKIKTSRSVDGREELYLSQDDTEKLEILTKIYLGLKHLAQLRSKDADLDALPISPNWTKFLQAAVNPSNSYFTEDNRPQEAMNIHLIKPEKLRTNEDPSTLSKKRTLIQALEEAFSRLGQASKWLEPQLA